MIITSIQIYFCLSLSDASLSSMISSTLLFEAAASWFFPLSSGANGYCFPSPRVVTFLVALSLLNLVSLLKTAKTASALFTDNDLLYSGVPEVSVLPTIIIDDFALLKAVQLSFSF